MSVGNYFVTVIGQDGCPNTLPVNISNGPVGLNFDLEVECYNNRQAVLLSNISAEDNMPFNIEVYRIGEIAPIDVITLNDLPAGRIFRITDATFLNAEGGYQMIFTQFQAVCGTTLESEVTNFEINGALNATIGEVTQSFPERGTGSIWLENVNGGELNYYTMIEPGDGQWIEVPQNLTSQEYEYQFTDLLPGDYEIFVADEKGCEIMFTVTVPQDTELFIPNVFTPNGDGYNDTFYVRNKPLDGVKLLISNRLGRKIFETDNYQNDWDGEDNADGIYYYTLQIGDEKYSGWVEMWRGGINK